MRNLLAVYCLLLAHIAFAQQEITVLHLAGKVFYYAPGNKEPQTVYPGQSLDNQGSFRCNAGATIKLLCKGKTFEFNDTKTHYLDEVAKQAGSTSSLSFMSRFWLFMSGSMENSESEEQLNQHHNESMAAGTAGVKGFAEKDFAIRAGMFYEGRLSDNTVEFSWTPLDTLAYCFQLTRQSDDVLIARIWTRGHTLSLNPAELSLDPKAAYEWQVTIEPGNAAAPHSRKMEFVYLPEGANRALAATRALEEYKKASPVEQQLMEAFALEEQEFYYDAAKRYQALYEANPGNLLVKRTYASFLAGIDQLDAAKALIK